MFPPLTHLLHHSTSLSFLYHVHNHSCSLAATPLHFTPMLCIITSLSPLNHFKHHSLHSIATPFLVPSIISDSCIITLNHCTQLLHHSLFPPSFQISCIIALNCYTTPCSPPLPCTSSIKGSVCNINLVHTWLDHSLPFQHNLHPNTSIHLHIHSSIQTNLQTLTNTLCRSKGREGKCLDVLAVQLGSLERLGVFFLLFLMFKFISFRFVVNMSG